MSDTPDDRSDGGHAHDNDDSFHAGDLPLLYRVGPAEGMRSNRYFFPAPPEGAREHRYSNAVYSIFSNSLGGATSWK